MLPLLLHVACLLAPPAPFLECDLKRNVTALGRSAKDVELPTERIARFLQLVAAVPAEFKIASRLESSLLVATESHAWPWAELRLPKHQAFL